VAITPAAPTDLAATANDDGTITLNWDANLDGLFDYFDLLVSHDGGAYTMYASGISRSARTFDLTDLAAGHDYSFHLVTTNAADSSAAASATATAVNAAGTASAGTLSPDDDGSSAYVALGFGINFYGVHADHVYVNNNGNITFSSANSAYTPNSGFADLNFAMIAPFFADVDTRELNNVAGGSVTYGAETNFSDPVDDQVHPTFGIHWNAVDYYYRLASTHTSLYNTFSLYLVNRDDTGMGNFDIIFKYGDLSWDTGDASGGINGRVDPNASDAHPARAGFSSGSGLIGTVFELGQSGGDGSMLTLQGKTQSFSIRMARPHLSVQDLAPQGLTYTDTNRGIMGVTTDAQGNASFAIHLVPDVFDAPQNVYTYHVLNAAGSEIYSHALPPTDLVNFTTSEEGLHTIVVTSSEDPTYSVSVRYYLAKLNVVWNEPNDSLVNNILYTGTGIHTNYLDNISRRSLEVYSGQKIALTYDTDLPASNNHRWFLNAPATDFINDYYVREGSSRDATNSDTATVVPVSSSDRNAQPFFLYAIADLPTHTFFLTYDCTINGERVTFRNSVIFNVHKPGTSIWNSPVTVAPGHYLAGSVVDSFAPVGAYNPVSMAGDRLVATVGVRAYDPTSYEGTLSWVQLISVPFAKVQGNGLFDTWQFQDYKLDNRYPYNSVPGTNAFSDAPGIEAFYANHLWLNVAFKDWLMWTPPGADSVPVPLYTFTWTSSGEASYAAGAWTLTRGSPLAKTTIVSTKISIYPTWTERFDNFN